MENQSQASVQLPTWKCHKEVWADSITFIEVHPDSGEHPIKDYSNTDWLLACGARVYVTNQMISRGVPRIGDYFVKYKDSYESWSPAKAFEEGYTKI